MGPLEIPALWMGQSDSGTSAIEARNVSPFVGGIAITGVPARVLAGRPLELELAAFGTGAGDGYAVSIASWISAPPASRLLSRSQGSLKTRSILLSLHVPLAAAGFSVLSSAPQLGPTQYPSR